MQTCRHIQKKLSAYQDGEVEPVEKEAIEDHLRTCDACRKEHEALIHTYEMFMSLPDMEPSPWLSSRIVEKVIRADEPVWVRVLGGVLRLVPRPAAMAMLTIVGLLGGAFLGNLLTDSRYRASPEFTYDSRRTTTMASLTIFDAAPPGSFSGSYLKMARYTKEASHENHEK